MFLKTPPMGWNSWNTFGGAISEELIMQTADAIVARGFRDAGYEYVVIDDCWSEHERDENGMLVADREKFPHGMKYLADYIHSKGLKFGMYSCAGPLTCAGYPGSYGHEFDDARFFAANGVDYLKYDYCYHPETVSPKVLYNRMRMALNATGRDIVFSACNWGCDDSHNWMQSVGADLYRSTGDIGDNFKSVLDIFNKEKRSFNLSGPGCFNDIDMLICGMYGKGNVAGTNGGCTAIEYRSHFAMWCMLSAPLMIGCDVRNCDEDTVKLLCDKELIAIDQDPACRPPIVIKEYLIKHLEGGEYAFALTNYGDSDHCYMHILLPDTGLLPSDGYGFKLRDIETGEELGIFTDDIHPAVMRGHETKIFRGTLVKLK